MTDSVATPELLIRQFVRADPVRVFDAWTDPAQVAQWWGPANVTCTHAEIDLRVGGSFRIGNELPDGTTNWISGVYEEIDPPTRLVHTWLVGTGANQPAELVTVGFADHDGGTEVTVRHTGIPTPELRSNHEAGWVGCLDGLRNLLNGPVRPAADAL